MKKEYQYWAVSLELSDDGLNDDGSKKYLSKQEILQTLRTIDLPAGVRMRGVKIQAFKPARNSS
jgi:hypothetical protein